jgi:hypothetical protein
VNVTFEPVATGARVGTLLITDDGGGEPAARASLRNRHLATSRPQTSGSAERFGIGSVCRNQGSISNVAFPEDQGKQILKYDIRERVTRLISSLFLLFVIGSIAVAQSCPEPLPFVKAVPCTPGPGLYIIKSVREFIGYQKAYSSDPVTIHDVEIAIQSGNAKSTQYVVLLTIEKSNGAISTKHLIVERSVGMWTKAHFLCEDYKKALALSVQELAPPVDFSLSE